MTFDALTLLDERSLALERFLGACLFARGIWDSTRAGDGIADVRVLEGGSTHLTVIGRVWLIADQTQETFCLELELEPCNTVIITKFAVDKY